MNKLDGFIDLLQTHVEYHTKYDNSISRGNIGWHIEHSLLVITKIIETVIQSAPSEYQWTFNFKRLIVFFIKRFPRGKAEAPDSVIPQSELDVDGLLRSIDIAKESSMTLEKCLANQYFVHPIFGKLNRDETIQFLMIHTNHHLKIIDDILKKYEITGL